MPRIATFVFFDTETTGLPKEENNRTKITELSLVAVQRDHLLDQSERLSRGNVLVRPRIVNKLTLCLNPRRLISDGSSSTSGLTNDLLENQTHFDERVFAMLDNFLKVLPKPVCLVAHNGHGFDFPMLKNHLEKINGKLPDDILCADSIYGLYDLSKKSKEEQIKEINSNTNITQDDTPLTEMQAINENTPKKKKVQSPRLQPGKKRKIYFEGDPRPSTSFKLEKIYEERAKPQSRSVLNSHNAEDDCIMLLEIAVKMGNEFIEWCDENCCYFSDINAMTIGVSLGD